MATFAELRERLSLDGKQFERVCKWFLETDPRYSDRLVNVWLWDDWPGRWGPDCGIDLVAEDRDGKNWAVQAKCYDPEYSVTKRDIDSFLSESTNKDIHHRLLIATTDQVGKNARGVIHRSLNISQLLLQDLKTAPVVWPSNPARLRGGGARKPVKRWPHQTQAINNITKNLGKRGQFISACGTGKTLAALWISERLEAKRTLVLVPSLTLLSQTVSEWLVNAKEPFAYLPVCSDDTVSRGNDAAVMFTSDLEYPVTTDPDDIATFLRKRGRQVVFSTYQSSHQIAEAQTRNRVPGFDLVIADEAHRCAGKVSSVYGTVLDDEAIRAKKRLFMTATPRTYTARVQKKAREADIEVASMDDEAVFGPVVHQLNFGEAIEKGLLSDYQVVVVGIDEGRYKQMVDKRRIVKADKDIKTDAETLAKHVALAKAIRDYDLRRTITFHSRINTASSFANMLPKVVSWMPPRHRPKVELVTDHVSGEMSTGERNRRLNRLRNVEANQSAVLTNAQCLSEGIDVPTLDGVAFIDPRRSQVDIVQAVGRAIRRSEDKTVGTIIIPVFLSDTDDPDTALNHSEFQPVWSIVRALRSHDDALGEALDGIRMEQGRGRGGGSLGPGPGPIVLDLPVSTKFVSAITTKIVEETTSTWLFFFGALEEFADRHGHSRVPHVHVEQIGEKEIDLGVWVTRQRTAYRKGVLSRLRVQSLEALPGWVWDPKEEAFQNKLAAFYEYVDREGHSDVPSAHVEVVEGEEHHLGAWVTNQISSFNRGDLPEHRVATFEAIPSWEWDRAEAEYRRNFRGVEQFARREGHFRVPQEHVEVVDGEELSLFSWVSNRRHEHKSGQLSAERAAELEALPGWVWDLLEESWRQHLEALRQFANREHHSAPPHRTRELFEGTQVKIGSWVNTQRTAYKQGGLSAERVAELEALPGWVWDLLEESWQQHLEALRQFANREGGALVRYDHRERLNDSELKLGAWISARRTEYHQGELTDERIAALEAIPGWSWDPLGRRTSVKQPKPGGHGTRPIVPWQRHFEALIEFGSQHGHTSVGRDHIADFKGERLRLGWWVSTQRSVYKGGRLRDDRIAALEELPGWAWSVFESTWQLNVDALQQYARREGHARVPKNHVEDLGSQIVKVGSWASDRRSEYAHGDLATERIAQLEEIEGWTWDLRKADFDLHFEALKQFAAREGHAIVPVGHVESFQGNSLQLGRWVSYRRGDFKQGNLSKERIRRLKAVRGWVWSVR